MGVFARIMEGRSSEAAKPQTIMIEATYLKAHHTALSLAVGRGRLIGCTPFPMPMDARSASS
jgi:hypothetical protein